jgi:hypothetical protein
VRGEAVGIPERRFCIQGSRLILKIKSTCTLLAFVYIILVMLIILSARRCLGWKCLTDRSAQTYKRRKVVLVLVDFEKSIVFQKSASVFNNRPVFLTENDY